MHKSAKKQETVRSLPFLKHLQSFLSVKASTIPRV